MENGRLRTWLRRASNSSTKILALGSSTEIRLDPNGVFKPLDSLDSDYLEKVFADELFDSLLEEELLSEDVVDSMRAWGHFGFNVFVGEAIAPDDSNARRFVGRYLKKSPVSNARLTILDDGTVSLRMFTDDNV